jgi:hypothetical protein
LKKRERKNEAYNQLSVKEMTRCGLKDRRGYRVNDTVGLENVGPFLVPNSTIFHVNT